MAEAFVAEIRILPYNFAPLGWAFCDGQILPIAQNTALFSLIGTTYGGNGTTNFALPNLQGRAAMHAGQGAGLSARFLGESAGSQVIALVPGQMAAHSHVVVVPTTAEAKADRGNASGNLLATPVDSTYATSGVAAAMNTGSSTPTGGGAAHNNMQPYLALNICIALQGIFPSRN